MADEKATTEAAAKPATKKPATKAASTKAAADKPAAAKSSTAKTAEKTSTAKKAPAKKATASAAADKAAASSKDDTVAAKPAAKSSAKKDVAAPREQVLKVHHLRPAAGSKKERTRVGRGEGSKGKTAGRGTKGTKARYQVRPGFQGGQLPLHMRAPKLLGFKNPFRVEYQVVNLEKLAELYPSR